MNVSVTPQTLKKIARAHAFESLPSCLYNAIRDLDAWHATRKACTSVSICDIRDVFQAQLSRIENFQERLW